MIRDLDAASSTPLHPAAREAFLAALDRGYADPRRLHGAGRDARLLLDNAREATAERLGVRPDEVSFTASGTDAIHRGLLGLVAGPDAATSSPTPPSSTPRCSTRSAGGRRATGGRRSTRCGRVGSRARRRRPGVAVVALQTANHEVGTLQPVGERELPGDVPLFTDACASIGRLPPAGRLGGRRGSAHKWGGPAGVGVLLVRKGARWRNPFPADDRVDDA